jgi:hypothetical protein
MHQTAGAATTWRSTSATWSKSRRSWTSGASLTAPPKSPAPRPSSCSAMTWRAMASRRSTSRRRPRSCDSEERKGLGQEGVVWVCVQRPKSKKAETANSVVVVLALLLFVCVRVKIARVCLSVLSVALLYLVICTQPFLISTTYFVVFFLLLFCVCRLAFGLSL